MFSVSVRQLSAAEALLLVGLGGGRVRAEFMSWERISCSICQSTGRGKRGSVCSSCDGRAGQCRVSIEELGEFVDGLSAVKAANERKGR